MIIFISFFRLKKTLHYKEIVKICTLCHFIFRLNLSFKPKLKPKLGLKLKFKT